MTRDELIALAKEAGMRHDDAGFVTDFNLHSVEFETLERFAALVAAKEREKMLEELRLLADAEGRVTIARKP